MSPITSQDRDEPLSYLSVIVGRSFPSHRLKSFDHYILVVDETVLVLSTTLTFSRTIVLVWWVMVGGWAKHVRWAGRRWLGYYADANEGCRAGG